MGLFSGIGEMVKGAWNAVKRVFGGGNNNSSYNGGGGSYSSYSNSNENSTTTYEPDKVKIAQIEADTQLKLAGMEKERIELMKNARLEMLEYETKSQMAIVQAQMLGFDSMAQSIIKMQDTLNEVAEKRLLIIEKGALPIIKDIENFYDELGQKIQEDADRYNTEKLPKLLEMLEKYEPESAPYQLYYKRIMDDMESQQMHTTMHLQGVLQRQQQVIDGFMESKKQIIDQTGQITQGILENVMQQQAQLLASPVNTSPALMASEQMALPEKVKQ